MRRLEPRAAQLRPSEQRDGLDREAPAVDPTPSRRSAAARRDPPGGVAPRPGPRRRQRCPRSPRRAPRSGCLSWGVCPPSRGRRNRSAGSLTRLPWRSQVRDTIHHCAQWVAEHGPELEERIRAEKGEGGNSDLWRFLFEDPRRSTAARCVPLRAAGPAPKNNQRDKLYVYSAGTTSSSCGTGTSWSGRSSRAPPAPSQRGAKPRRSARARQQPSPTAARRSGPAASRRPLARRCSATCMKTPWRRWRRRSS